jgi:heme/copper-type cytochrome/quinol oxidase subunit 2
MRATLVHSVLLLTLPVLLLLFVRATGDGLTENLQSLAIGLRVGGLVVFAFLHSVVTASYEAACLRWFIRGERMGFGGFSLSGDTWRVYAGYWVWFAVSFGVWLVVIVVSALLVAGFNVADDPGSQEWVGLAAISSWIIAIAPFALRASPGNAASIAKRKFAYFEGGKISSGRLWALIGSFLIVWVIWAVLFVALFIGAVFLIFMATQGQPDAGVRLNTMSALAMAASVGCANLMLAFLSAGVNARAVIAAAEEGKIEGVGTNVAAVFD